MLYFISSKLFFFQLSIMQIIETTYNALILEGNVNGDVDDGGSGASGDLNTVITEAFTSPERTMFESNQHGNETTTATRERSMITVSLANLNMNFEWHS